MTDSDNGARDESRQCTSHISIAHDENSNDQAASRDEPCTNRCCLHLLFCLFPDSGCGGIAWFVGQLSVNQSVNYKQSRQAKGIRTSERQSGHSSLSGPRLAGDFVTNCRMQSVQNEC